MSLEQAIQENTAAIKELTAAWLKLTSNAATIKANPPADGLIKAGGVPVAATPEPEQKAKAETKAKAEPKPKPEPEPEPQPEAAEPAVDYPTLQKAVFALANAKGRDAVVELMKTEFGVGSAKELKPEQWSDALAKVNAALEA